MVTNPGSQSALRSRNIEIVLKLLRQHGPQTQADLARISGLSTATISNIVNLLVAKGSLVTSGTTSNGRRARQVSLKPSSTYYIGVVFYYNSTKLLIADVNNTIIEKKSWPAAKGYSDVPSRITPFIGELTKLLKEKGIAAENIRGVGIGLPSSSLYPQHRDLVIDKFAPTGIAPVAVNTNADLGALAHTRFDSVLGARKYLYIDVTTTISAGFAIDGLTYSDANRAIGEVGHVVVNPAGWLCECGGRGCLNTLASTRAITSQLHQVDVRPESEAEIFQDKLSNNPVVARILQRAGHATGQIAAHGAQFLGPDVVVIGAAFTPLSPSFMEGFQYGFKSLLPLEIENRTTVVRSAIPGGAALKGAILLGISANSSEATTNIG